MFFKNSGILQRTQGFANSEFEIVAEKRPKKPLYTPIWKHYIYCFKRMTWKYRQLTTHYMQFCKTLLFFANISMHHRFASIVSVKNHVSVPKLQQNIPKVNLTSRLLTFTPFTFSPRYPFLFDRKIECHVNTPSTGCYDQ